MLKLHVIQAEFGDCLLLEYGTSSKPRFTLIDGGPPGVYERHLRPVLQEIGGAGVKLDLVALSHVDNDHIIGLLDYFAELRSGAGAASLPAAGGLWHNSFGRAIDPDSDIDVRLQSLITNTRAAVMTTAGMAVNGISEGNSLRLAAQALQIPINDGFPDDLIVVDTAPASIKLDNLMIRIAGPTQANLDALRAEWEEWLDTHEDAIGTDDPLVMANSDQSVPNLSSVMFLVEGGGRTILFTGDGRSDHLLDGLGQAALLDDKGRMHVDVLKLPHHGSNRNATRTFFKKVTADTYVASANGRDDNPDLATLIWIVEAARDQQRRIKLVATNGTPSVKKLLEEYDRTEYGYDLDVLPANRHRTTLDLA
jgi:hypothetical protein